MQKLLPDIRLKAWPSFWLLAILAACGIHAAPVAPVAASDIPFQHTTIDPEVYGDTKALGDIDGDGFADIVFASNALYWYRYPDWDRIWLADAEVEFTTEMQLGDIDGDNDLDVIVPDGQHGDNVLWFENPGPNGDPAADPWSRHAIGAHGTWAHDVAVGDINGDSKLDVVTRREWTTVWLQNDPVSWTSIWVNERGLEGLALGDLDGDGDLDIAINGYWIETPADLLHDAWVEHTIDPNWPGDTRANIADLNEDGRLDVLLTISESTGSRITWYEGPADARSETWTEHVIDDDLDFVHTLEVADLDLDGDLDVVFAEMAQSPRQRVGYYRNNGNALNWTQQVIATTGSHNARVADVGYDGDIDIMGANWQRPPLDLWENQLGDTLPSYNQWQRHVIDAGKPWRSVFITPADINGDGQMDVITGGWWYENPGMPGGAWIRHVIGAPLDNMATVYDFDGDGDMDILGTAGRVASAHFAWAENDGAGHFTIWQNIEDASGDFLQGVAVGRLEGELLQVALSWHEGGQGLQRLTVPADPTSDVWTWDRISAVSHDEEITAGDIDQDGDLDLLLGTQWLRNDGETWTAFTLHETDGRPDRNRLADINGDGRLDAVVGYEAISVPGTLAWYEQGATPTDPWVEHIIAQPIGPMSLDVADLDRDGDLDVIVGEHNLSEPASARLLIYNNTDGAGGAWQEYVAYTGDEHHDGTQVADIDGDGDLDIVSIGWGHNQVLLYENTAVEDESQITTPVAATTPTVELTETVLESPTNTPTPNNTQGSQRVLEGLQALYTFEEGEGTVVHDVSGVGAPLDLYADDAVAIHWVAGGLSVDVPTIIVSNEAATRVTNAVQASGALTIEAWIAPANTSQDGPARIVSISLDVDSRNVTLGQGLWGDRPADVFDVRLRTTGTDNSGMPSLTTPAGTVTTGLAHVVYTRDATGTARIYVNGNLAAESIVGGDLSNWNDSYPLALANELTDNRPWLGEYYLVAIYNQALSAEEVNQNYTAGPGADEPCNG